jgi:hypothetical protein
MVCGIVQRVEPMTIHLLSVVVRDGRAIARARAVAVEARISIEVWFVVRANVRRKDLWQRARDEMLRYLDPSSSARADSGWTRPLRYAP